MLTAVRYLPAALRRLVVDGADVPRDLASVTTIASDEERDPQRVGMTREGVDAIWRSVENMYATGMHPGISLSSATRTGRAEARASATRRATVRATSTRSSCR